MTKELAADEKSMAKRPKPPDKASEKQRPTDPERSRRVGPGPAAILRLQQQVGNRAVQRLLAQRKGGEEGFDLDDATANRINRERGGGQALDSAVQKQMGESMGHDFSGVRVHDSSESDTLNKEINAKAFTTGQDIFFKQGEYNPGSSGGQELLAHELTHVVQQSTGQVPGSGSGMTVRPANDSFEQEADSTAQQAVQAMPIQRQEEEEVQAKSIQRQEDEELLQGKFIQRQDEEELQMKSIQRQDEEELLQGKFIQRQEEEEIQAKSIQRQDEEELQMKPIQRQPEPEPEEEEVMAKRDDAIQRQEEEEVEA